MLGEYCKTAAAYVVKTNDICPSKILKKKTADYKTKYVCICNS